MAEMHAIREVSREYGLTAEQTALMVSIRKAENGAAGIEFGVGQEQPSHPARRYSWNAILSFRIQARWTAGTIRRRYRGDIDAFASRWCPRNRKVWAANVKRAMKAQGFDPLDKR